jgi:hypothetical protein
MLHFFSAPFKIEFCFSPTLGTTDNTSNELKRTIDYIKFLSSLIGDCFAIQPEMVYLEIYDYEFINKWLMKFRPGDFCFFFVVEI